MLIENPLVNHNIAVRWFFSDNGWFLSLYLVKHLMTFFKHQHVLIVLIRSLYVIIKLPGTHRVILCPENLVKASIISLHNFNSFSSFIYFFGNFIWAALKTAELSNCVNPIKSFLASSKNSIKPIWSWAALFDLCVSEPGWLTGYATATSEVSLTVSQNTSDRHNKFVHRFVIEN